jgi:hypothetical protein
MEWIKSQEAPKPEEIASTKQIVCPVCKAPIKLDRRTDYIVMLADLVQRVAKGLMIPAALSAIVGTIVSGLFVYGFNTMHIFFGSAEAMRMMQPSHQDIYLVQRIRNSRLLGTFLKSTTFLDPFIPTTPMPTLLFGLPLIAPGLILARTEVADNFFTILPISVSTCHPVGASKLIDVVFRIPSYSKIRSQLMATISSPRSRHPPLSPKNLQRCLHPHVL